MMQAKGNSLSKEGKNSAKICGLNPIFSRPAPEKALHHFKPASSAVFAGILHGLIYRYILL
jgi:hypothetical protein